MQEDWGREIQSWWKGIFFSISLAPPDVECGGSTCIPGSELLDCFILCYGHHAHPRANNSLAKRNPNWYGWLFSMCWDLYKPWHTHTNTHLEDSPNYPQEAEVVVITEGGPSHNESSLGFCQGTHSIGALKGKIWIKCMKRLSGDIRRVFRHPRNSWESRRFSLQAPQNLEQPLGIMGTTEFADLFWCPSKLVFAWAKLRSLETCKYWFSLRIAFRYFRTTISWGTLGKFDSDRWSVKYWHRWVSFMD